MECRLRACEKLVDVRFLSTCSRHGGAANESIATSTNSEGSTLRGASPLTSLCLVTLAAGRGAVVAEAPKKAVPDSQALRSCFCTPRGEAAKGYISNPKRPAPSRNFARNTSCLATLNLQAAATRTCSYSCSINVMSLFSSVHQKSRATELL